MYNNNLLNRFQNYQQKNIPFQNNALLRNNPTFRNNMSYNNSQQQQKMQMMYMANIEKQRKIQEIRQLEKLNRMANNMDNNKLRELIIKPYKEEKKSNSDLMKKWKKEEVERNPTRERYWKKRTNLPYKNIIKDRKHIDKFINPKRKITKKDLIVHRITNADKNRHLVEKKLNKLRNNLETHNKELKVIYSTSKKLSHKKKFEYYHKYKQRVQYNPSEHNKLKKDKITHYKKEQKKMESNKKYLLYLYLSLYDDND